MRGYGESYAVTVLNSASESIPCSSFYTVKAWRDGKVGYLPYRARAYGVNQAVPKCIRQWEQLISRN